MPTGGSATINGVLYQTLACLAWAAQLSFTGTERDGDLREAQLIIEPPGGGGDLRVGRIIEQWKSQEGGGTWSLNAILSDVLPDLYRAIRDDDLETDASYRFMTEGRIGDWLGARRFFGDLSREVPDDPLSRLDDTFPIHFGRSRDQTERTFFRDVVERLRTRPHIAEEPRSLTTRKTWHLLSRFEIVGGQYAEMLIEQVDKLLRAVVIDYHHISEKRDALCGWIIRHAAKGPVTVTPTQLLQEVGLSPAPLINLARSELRSQECLRKAFERLNYYPEEDIRTVPGWPQEKRILVFAGESGQGKTWQLAATAQNATLHGLVSLTSATESGLQSWTEANDFVWQKVLGYGSSSPLLNLLPRLREFRPGLLNPRVTLCLDDIQRVEEANHVIGRVIEEEDSVRLALTTPPELGKALRDRHPNHVALIEVADFDVDELRRYLEMKGHDWGALPYDVSETLRRPLLASLYCTVASETSWSPTHEYELYQRYWALLRHGRQQFEHPGDQDRMAELGVSIMRPNATYPWPAEVLRELGIDDQMQRRLEALGWLQRLPDGRVRVWHDRLLNWAVAEGLIRRRRHGTRSTTKLGEELRRCITGLHAGQQLAYVPMDVIWLASEATNHLAADVGDLIASIEGEYPSRLYSHLLPTLGERVIPALLARARANADDEGGPYSRFVASALAAIGTAKPERVSAEAASLLLDPLSILQHTGLRLLRDFPNTTIIDRLWEIHVEHQRRLATQDRDRYDRYEASWHALRSSVRENPPWLIEKIRTVDPDREPVSELAYLVANLDDPSAHVWQAVKEDLFRKVPAAKARSLARCIHRFKDAEEVPRLQAWITREDDWVGVHALRALTVIDPDQAVNRLPQVPMPQLVMMRGHWLPALLAQRPSETCQTLRQMLTATTNVWFLSGIYSGFENALDAETLDVLLRELECSIDEYVAAGDKTTSSLYRPLSFFARISARDLLQVLQAQAGTPLERKLTSTACSWLARAGVSADHELEAAQLLLLKIGGEGFTTLVNAQLDDPHDLVRNEGLGWALVRPNEQTRTLLRAISLRDDPDTGFAGRLRRESTSALAALGDDKAVTAAIMHGGLAALSTDLVAIRRERAPMADSVLVEALTYLEQEDAERHDRAILVIGLSGRCEHSARVWDALGCAPVDSQTALAGLLALDWLDYQSESFVTRLVAQLAIPAHRRHAADALFRIGTPAALDALARDAVTVDGHVRPDHEGVLVTLWQRSGRPADAPKKIRRTMLAQPHLPPPIEFFDVIGDLDDIDVQEYLRKLAFQPDNHMTSSGRRAAAIQALAARDLEGAYRAAERALTESEQDREVLPVLLVQLDAGRAVKTLCRCAPNERDVSVLWAIGRALRRADRTLVDQEIARMLNNHDAHYRRAGAELAGWFGSFLLSGEVYRLSIEDHDEQVQAAARSALQRARDEDEARSLVNELGSASEITRWSILHGIVALADPVLLMSSDDQFGMCEALRGAGHAFRKYVKQQLKRRVKALHDEAGRLSRQLD